MSRDGAWIALTKIRTNADSDVFVVRSNAPEAEPVHVTPHEGDISHGVADFAPDGSKLFFSSNAGGEFDRIWAYDLATGERSVAYEDDWDVLYYTFSKDGRYVVTGVNEDAPHGDPRVRRRDGRRGRAAGDARGRRHRDLHRAGGPPHGLLRERGHLALGPLHARPRDGTHERLTRTLNPAIDRSDLVQAENVRYPSFDGLEIPALLYRPQGATASAPAPALVYVHGGPGGQCRKGYNPRSSTSSTTGTPYSPSTTAAAPATGRRSSTWTTSATATST